MTADYTKYTQYVETVCASGDLSSFKTHPSYKYMLEHVTQSAGLEYLQHIKKYTAISNDEIAAFSTLNDSLGAPSKMDFGFLSASTTNMRYIYQSHLILTHLQSLNLPQIDIVELGGGYGGLCLALHHFAAQYSITINSYTIIDLSAPSALQKLYIGKLQPELRIEFVDAANFGAELQKKDMFLISNYCFSEISGELQKKYIANLFPKVAHGFMAWNYIKTYDFGFAFKEEKESPNTGGEFNKYVYF